MTIRHPYDGDAARRAILAVAIPGKLLPPQSAIAKLIGLDQANVSYHLDRLRDDWRIVTKEVRVWQEGSTWPKRRLLVVSVTPPKASQDARAASEPRQGVSASERVDLPAASPKPAGGPSQPRQTACGGVTR